MRSGLGVIAGAGPSPAPAPSPSPSLLPAPSSSPSPHGLLGRFLVHPGATERAWWHDLLAHLTAFAHAVLPVVTALVAAVVELALLVAVLRAARARRAGAGARWVEIIPPELPGSGGGLAWWRLLGPLLRSDRLLAGGQRRPVALEFLADPAGLRAGLWVSATVSADAVARTVAAAWPGAHARVTDPPPLFAPARTRVGGGRLVLARAECFPLGGTDTAGVEGDPLRGVLAAVGDCRSGETAVMQVLARPASGRRVARARRAAWALRTGRPASRLARLAGGLRTQQRQPVQAGPDPVGLADVRVITGKVTDVPHFLVAVRFAVTCPAGWGRAGRRRLAGRRREIAAGFGLFTGPNRLVGRRLPRADRAVAGRRLARGFLASAGELAALAHLPADPARAGMACGSAGRIPVPVEVPYH